LIWKQLNNNKIKHEIFLKASVKKKIISTLTNVSPQNGESNNVLGMVNDL